jgi:hypothetical protein
MIEPSNVVRLLLMTTAFSMLYLLTLGVLRRSPSIGLNSAADIPHKAANHITGLVFSTAFLLATVHTLFSQDQLDFCGITTDSQLLLEEFSFSYFLFDLIRLALVEPQDYPWLLHHLISQLYTLTNMDAGVCGCGYIIAGAAHEITHPLRSIWHLARLAQQKEWFFTLSAVLTWTFVATRVFLIPVIDYVLILKGFLPAANAGRLSKIYATGWSVLAMSMLILHLWWTWQLTQGYIKLRKRVNL